ncbi:Sedoheptulose-1,7-bisphosphatase, chloroplastic [Staphylotrichum tortipilum]|uniref:Sedoheptulose-1,7-bisphosphatase, chloroplastic n=1 Tax=Staphylotrichum tortipilum TaxID=2831512 RepID=A0AAN6RQG5_9PEZI|nr:Sedoheptulose-1,7-bisphosphatase, chloroplastic [Staphylotrichum longicolle]
MAECPSSSFIAHLRSVLPKDGTREALITSVIPTLLESIADVAEALRNSHHVAAAGTANSFGDDQLNVDVTAENLIRSAIARCPTITTASSEEDPVERRVQHTTPPPCPSSAPTSEEYTLAFDPLDGSSIIRANWTVGAILSLWDGPTALHQPPATAQIASLLGVFGPRTTAILALRVPNSGLAPVCIELALSADRAWHVATPQLALADTARYFSPANLRAAAEDPAYLALVTGYVARRYTLRYAGGLVPDVVHMLVQGEGVYVSPVTAGSKAKLRRLYELCPLALVVECARGRAVDPVDGRGVLEREVRGCDERGGLVCGSAGEVGGVVERLVEGQ